MVMDSQEALSLNKTLYAAPRLAVSLAGDGTWGAPVAGLARIEPSNQYLRTSASGEEVTSTWQIFTLLLIQQGDRIWLPGANIQDPTVAHQVKQVDVLYDDDGSLHHYEVMV